MPVALICKIIQLRRSSVYNQSRLVPVTKSPMYVLFKSKFKAERETGH